MTKTARREEPSSETSRPLFSLFVYGTLRTGGANHDRFCSGAHSIEPGAIVGRLTAPPAGYPMVTVPREAILLRGTPWGLWDAVRAEAVAPRRIAAANRKAHGSGDFRRGRASSWKLLPGEVLTFDDPQRLAALDRLEGFRPGEASLYERVLVPICGLPGRAAWVFVAPASAGSEGSAR